ncbi:type I polyketide synthase [Nocardia sp. NPDC051756]|uniref:type I polyketide synthase n=1 Tax=Nocardia sp. NPDC051756 TaxID=3154751 RepID=UPI0034135E96
MSASNDTPIAIVGMGCRFAGGVESAAGLWDLMSQGRDTAGPVPAQRWDALHLMAFQHPDEVERYGWGCFLDGDVWSWDPEALSVAAAERESVDPQFRVLMEVAWESVEHAGIPMDRIRGSRTGVYVGTYAADNMFREARPIEDALSFLYVFGNFTAGAGGRVAFAMDLRGPVMTISTHCSSGMVAVDAACSALTNGDCDLALAGAVLLMLSPETHHYEAPWLLSKHGRCFAFDARADGYVRGEGAGMLVLKRLADARRDGDRVLAVVRGSAVNNDGQATRLTAPSTIGQQNVFRAALANAKAEAGEVGLVEAHGPGTAVGDPIEYTSINAVYGRGRGRCALGSVKTNIGHTEPVSGIAGIIKAVECLQRGWIPPNLNFQTWNPAIPLDEQSRLFVPTEMTRWPVRGGARLAAVCSYGVTGTNGHLILEQAPDIGRTRRTSGSADSTVAQPLRAYLLSATTSSALNSASSRLADWASGSEVALTDVVHTLAVRRSHGPQRLGVLARTRAELVDRARAFADNTESPGTTAGGVLAPVDDPGPVFVFTGQGSQWPGMCRELLDVDPVFTAAIDKIEPLVAAESGFSVREMITAPAKLNGIDQIQPVLFAVQIALAQMWAAWGVRPTAVIGQSMGEAAAAVIAGGLSLADGVLVICRRTRLLTEVTGGSMASVLLPVGQVEKDLATAGSSGVSVAVISSPGATVISGDATQVDDLVRAWQDAGVSAQKVSVDVASHSPQVDPILERLGTELSALHPGTAEITFYSTVADDPCASGTLDGDYWVANLRRPVRFQSAVAAALDRGHRLFLECSPHALAVRSVTDIAGHQEARGVLALGSLVRDTDDQEAFLTQLTAVHCAGFEVDWASHYSGELADVPGTAWNRTHSGGDQLPYRLVAPGLVGADQHPLLGGYVRDPDQPDRHLWQTPLGPARLPWLDDHQVAGIPVLPGAGFVEMMLAAGARVFGTDRIAVTDLRLLSPLVLVPEPVVTTRVTRDGDGARVDVVSETDDGPQIHAQAVVGPLGDGYQCAPLDLAGLSGLAWREVVPADLYRVLRAHGVYHGAAFANVERIQQDPESDHALATIRIADGARVSSWMMALHPALTDELVQAVVSVWLNHYDTPGPVMVAGFDEVRVYGPTAHARLAEVWVQHCDDLSCIASGVLATTDGQVVAEVRGLRLANVTPAAERFVSRLTHLAWVPSPPIAAEPLDGISRWLVIGEEADGWPNELCEALTERGAQCHFVHAAMNCDVGQAVRSLVEPTANGGWSGVVLTLTDDDSSPSVVAVSRVARACALTGALARLSEPPRLWIATRADGPSPACGGVRGVARVAAYECPQLTPSMIEFDGDTRLLADDLLTSPATPIEIAWRGGSRFTAQIHSGPSPETSPDAALPTPVQPGAAYVVTGGTGGLGLLTAAWLVERGAGHLVLCGRSAPGPEAELVLDELRAAGTTITLIQGDIADLDVATRAVHTAAACGPLKGMIHAAGVVEDATLANVDADLLARVWQGKANGAWALHRATLEHDLDFWVVYSSVASLLGSPGQGAYAAANAFLDELVRWRRDNGLRATGICWGAWSQAGRGQHMAERGVAMISPHDGIDALDRILTAGYTHVAYSPIDLERWIQPYPALRRSELFAGMLADSHATDASSSAVLESLLAADTEPQRRNILEEHIIECVRDLMGGTTRHIGPGTSMIILGVDSLAAVQLQNRLQHTLGITIEGGVVWVRPTPAGLADWILHRMGFHKEEANAR